ncbi:DUF4241 domain-containing protein [Streptomyces peucetius]|uniref:DUF4241 domain-containing protein n=1 Tax=Streptomyces peucetius TaxID=1950 RepID=A0ABY6IFC8_STRPE|nr:DUF4241 domain-containing protein [Streptomyces peucetius]UYQ65727.1 DUF4241 domain-containing protein [Streptomyces peucetius]
MAVESVCTVEVTYCEGWDPAARAAGTRMPESETRRRDESGEPYAVLLSFQGQAKALFQVDWRHGYLGLFLFDGQARRTQEYEYRQLEAGRLHLRRYEQRRPASGTGTDSPESAWRFTLTINPDGRACRILDAGGSLQVGAEVPAEHRTVAKAEFGAWTGYVDARMLGLAGPITLVQTPPRAEAPVSPGAASWSAPMPLQPRHLEALFTPGTRLAFDQERTAVIAEPAGAGLLSLPTGSVIAGDPCTIDDALPFTVTVPPGDYPVLISTMRWEGDGWGETPAAMLRILDKPAARWELALRPGEDARLLGSGEFYGFGVDSGTACFLDASGRDTLPKIFEQQLTEWEADRDSCTVSDPASGINLIAYLSGYGDGSYPVWIGRDAEGAVTCFVADMLVLHNAETLPPTVTRPAACVSPFSGRVTDRRDAPFPDPGSTSEFIKSQIADIVEFRQELRSRRPY